MIEVMGTANEGYVDDGLGDSHNAWLLLVNVEDGPKTGSIGALIGPKIRQKNVFVLFCLVFCLSIIHGIFWGFQFFPNG